MECVGVVFVLRKYLFMIYRELFLLLDLRVYLFFLVNYDNFKFYVNVNGF